MKDDANHLKFFSLRYDIHSEFQLLFAASPLLALAYVLFSAFEAPEAEALKRRKKGDFELEGHGE